MSNTVQRVQKPRRAKPWAAVAILGVLTGIGVVAKAVEASNKKADNSADRKRSAAPSPQVEENKAKAAEQAA